MRALWRGLNPIARRIGVKVKNPKAPAVKRKAVEDCSPCGTRKRSSICRTEKWFSRRLAGDRQLLPVETVRYEKVAGEYACAGRFLGTSS